MVDGRIKCIYREIQFKYDHNYDKIQRKVFNNIFEKYQPVHLNRWHPLADVNVPFLKQHKFPIVKLYRNKSNMLGKLSATSEL
jgi:hypothetical protein